MKHVLTFLLMWLLAAPAVAQPGPPCPTPPNNSVACFSPAQNLQQYDVLSGMQAIGPTTSPQSVKIMPPQITAGGFPGAFSSLNASQLPSSSYGQGLAPGTVFIDPNGHLAVAGSVPIVNFTAINLSSTTFVEGSAANTIIGAIQPILSQGTFSGTLALSGTNASSFALSSPNAPANLTCPTAATCPSGPGPYAITITAQQNGVVNSPFQANFLINGIAGASFTAINLSNNTFQGGAPSGTVVGTVTPILSTGTYVGSTPTLGGANASSFQVVGSAPTYNLETNGVLANGSYSITLTAAQTGISNSPYTVGPLTITGGGCSNSLDFSQSCNSQYIPAVMF